ncbi:hypothetical protein VNO77_20121 [Canavalia gladiata]|uniref:Glabrous enhancer-binding protein-like DBD domain-containing protein n=1 Tax=Canavalia gladiata TaxID=3824 RepID=A0AAN9QQ94_CANGL
MAQKRKQRNPPLDDPPTASSSDSEEDAQRKNDAEGDEEVGSSFEVEASSEEEDGDDEEEEPPTPPTSSHSKPSSSELDLHAPTPAKVKPFASKPMEQAQKANAQPNLGSKRAVENNAHATDSKRAKKKITDSCASDEEDGKKSGEQSKKLFQRLWSEEDELAILKGMVDFTSKTGQDPYKYATSFHDFMKKSLHVEASSNQLKEKIRRLKKKFETNTEKGKNDESPRFSKLHDQMAFELSKKVWGTKRDGEGASAGVESSKKEGSNRNAASAMKLKLETRPEPEVVSVDGNEFGKMEIHQKPDSASSLLSEMSRFQNSLGVYGMDEDEVKRGLELMEESKRVELEAKWKQLRAAELKLFMNRALLVGEQAKLILEAIESSNH